MRLPCSYGRYSLALLINYLPYFSLNTISVFDGRPYLTPGTIDYAPYKDLKWRNMIVTFDGSNSNVNLKRKIYIDGNLVTNTSYPFDEGTLMWGGIVQPTGDIYIGPGLTGDLDDIKVYNRLLNASEISFLSTYVSPCCP